MANNEEKTLDCPACHKPINEDQIGGDCPWCGVLIVQGSWRLVKWWVNEKHPGAP